MRIYKHLVFLLQFVTIGLAAAFVILYLYPPFQSGTSPDSPVVEIKEAPLDSSSPRAPIISYADAVDRAAPAVVNVFTKKTVKEEVHPLLKDPLFRRFFGGDGESTRPRQETSLGSGVIISPEGYILTNNHVISMADEIEVGLPDGRTAKASLIGTDPETDLAVLKIDLPDLKVITLGHSRQLRVGDVVLAIGNPFGVGQAVTSGIVSATGRDMLGINTFENFIQTDAAINPGNSGGALINAQGDLIGINSAIFSQSGGSQGIGFAIPIKLARNVMQQIIEHGHVIRGWLGVAIQDVTEELARSFSLPSQNGVIITNIVVDGPADQAGLTRGDAIIRINDQTVTSVRHALTLISQTRPGSTITVTILRQGKELQKQVTVMERPVSES
ncbi:MAG: Do family serine endopeptidase [Proteobacteria bacterium]|jgi:serine protease DegS|nr:Do family serine endopeptidase [Pseudomonadota bacterium]MCG6934373.1 Do family serine endopeptidase [Pseudomonadota bacterium]